jgi:hypothetical protein
MSLSNADKEAVMANNAVNDVIEGSGLRAQGSGLKGIIS